MSVNELVIF